MKPPVCSIQRRGYLRARRRVLRGGVAGAVLLSTPALGGCLAANHVVATVRDQEPEQEFVIDLPPVDLPAGSDHTSAPQPEPYWTLWPESGWLHGFTVEVVDASGNALPETLLHHVKVVMPGGRELFAPIMLRVVGAGSETRAGSLPRSVGVPIQAGDSLLATAMVHNPVDRAYNGARVRVRLRYTPGHGSDRVAAVFPFFLHVTPPVEHSGYDLPPGRSERSWEARPAVAGRVIAFGGHAHRYGRELRLEDVESGRVLWRTRIHTDADGMVTSVPRTIYRWSRGVALDPQRLYRVTAIYENPTPDTLRDAGMGTIGGVFRPAGVWPAVDRSDELYILDRAREEKSHHGSHRHH